MNDPHDEAPLPAASTDTSAQSPTSKATPLSKAAALAKSVGAPAPASEPAPIKGFEEWALAKKTDAHWLLAACVVNHWAIGRQVSEADFDAAIDAAQKVEMR